MVDTGLSFIIHAPFLLTDNREGIHAGEPHNIKMISLLSELAADSFSFLRDIGQTNAAPLVDDNVLDIILYGESDFTDVRSRNVISFRPFYAAIKKAKSIIPSSSGYVTSSNAFWGGADNRQLAEVFSNQQLATLSKNNEAKWIFPSISIPRSAEKSIRFDYIKDITGNTITENAFLDLIDDYLKRQKHCLIKLKKRNPLKRYAKTVMIQ